MAREEGRSVARTPSGLLGRACCRFHSDSGSTSEGRCAIGHHLPRLLDDGLVALDGDEVSLTAAGLRRGEQLIRRHRLAEMLLTQLLDMDTDCNDEEVCLLEHALSDKVTDRICAFLGHPPACPHGRVIPRGDCCAAASEVSPLVFPLADARPGENYRIVFITPRHHSRLDRLGVLGIMPGTDVRLHQKKPSYVLRIGESDIAVDKEIASEIFVRPI